MKNEHTIIRYYKLNLPNLSISSDRKAQNPVQSYIALRYRSVHFAFGLWSHISHLSTIPAVVIVYSPKIKTPEPA